MTRPSWNTQAGTPVDSDTHRCSGVMSEIDADTTLNCTNESCQIHKSIKLRIGNNNILWNGCCPGNANRVTVGVNNCINHPKVVAS